MASPLRDPATLPFQRDSVRRLIIAAYWAVVLLAAPIWWHLTSINRLPLPTARIHDIPERIQLPLELCIEHNNPALASTLAPRLRSETLVPVISQKASCPDTEDGFVVRFKEGPSMIEDRTIYLDPTVAADAAAFADTLEAVLLPKRTTSTNHVAQYAPRYRLAFSLLNEDAAADPGAPTSWAVQYGLHAHIQPLLSQLSQLHNFTIESQVQFHAPLAFSPVKLEDDKGYGITPEDLSVFVNSEEWTLSSGSSNDPVLHFILFIPSPSHRPLYILDKEGNSSPSTTFLLPQWGGIIIHNPPPSDSPPSDSQLPSPTLHDTFISFSSLLRTLLGVPPFPPSIQSRPDASTLTPFHLSALIRHRTLETYGQSRETLLSLVKLVDQIENMPVGEDVQGDVEGALEGLLLASSPSASPHSSSILTTIFAHTSFSSILSSRAFFNPGMLALLYFPAEHKYAVYTPLFASALIPLFVAGLREFKAWKAEKARKAKRD